MSPDRPAVDFDALMAGWLEDGPRVVPDRVLDAVLDEIHGGRLRRAWGGLWPFRPVTRGAPRVLWLLAGLVTATILMVAGASLVTSPPRTGLAGSSPLTTTSPPATSIPGPGPSPTPYGTVTVFSSPRYGYTVTVPAGWLVIPASTAWDGSSGIANDASDVDQLLPPQQQGRCQSAFVCAPQLWALSAPFSGSLQAWVTDRDAADAAQHPCPATPESERSTVVGGSPAVIESKHCPTGSGPLVISAYAVAGGRAYAFSLQEVAHEPAVEALDQQEFVALLGSVELTP